MKYMLDTNVCIGLLKGASLNLKQRIADIAEHDIVIPAVVRFELYYGAYKSNRREQSLAALNDFLPRYASIPLDNDIARLCGEVRADLEAKGTPIGPV